MTYEQQTAAFQKMLDAAARGETIQLPTREFPGPMSISQPITLEGGGGTVWALAGPVLTVMADGVVLRNIKIEVTGTADEMISPEEQCALLVNVRRGISIENVEVRGLVLGLAEEEGVWKYPHVLNLGHIRAGVAYQLRLRLVVPIPCRLISNISGVEVAPAELSKGPNEVRLQIEPLPRDILLRGSISLATRFVKRSIELNAIVPGGDDEFDPNLEIPANQVVWEPRDWWTLTGGTPPSGHDLRPPTVLIQRTDTVPSVPSPHKESSRQLPAEPDVKPEITVSATGASQHTTITEAIRATAPGSRILIRSGIYKESLVLDRWVEIQGDGPRAQVIVESADANCVLMQTEYAKVRGLTLRSVLGQRGLERHSVFIPRGQLVMEDCEVASSFAGIVVQGSNTRLFLRNCTIHSENSAGLVVTEHATAMVDSCAITGCGLAGVEIRRSGNPVLQHCKISQGKQAGVLVHEQGEGTLEECDIFDNALAGVEIRSDGTPTLRRCKIRDGKYPGLLIHDHGRGTILGCDISANVLAGVEIRREGNPVIQKCRIRDGKQAGILCTENGLGSVEDCIIADNGLAGVELRESSAPVFKRCKIQQNAGPGVAIGGRSEGIFDECEVSDNQGAGVEICNAANPSFRKCTVHGGKQAGLLVWGNGRGSLEECDIFGNDWSGLMVFEGGNPILRKCNIREAKMAGIVVHERGAGAMDHCTIVDNGLAGVVVTGGGSPTLQHCRINRNVDVAIWAYHKGAGRIVDCDLRDNGGGSVLIEGRSSTALRGNTEDE